MTTITVLAGERTIGGTQIVVEDRGARLLFDCGLAFEPASNPFAYVHRRPRLALVDLLQLGLVPYVPGLYRPELLTGMELPPAPRLGTSLTPQSGHPEGTRPAGPLAVALSHSHLDHTHLVGFVDPAVPVYASDATVRIVRLLGEVGASIGNPRRSLDVVAPDEVVVLGSMRIRMLPVDHDVAGARGLLIETSDGVIAYPGDMRLHGLHPMLTLEFAQAARDAAARLLILEGTMLRPPPGPEDPPEGPYDRTEADVVPDAMAALEPGRLGVVLLTPENGERVEALARATAAAARLFVLDLEGLAFARAALGRSLDAPHAVYVPSGLDSTFLPGLSETLEAAPRVVRAEEMAADPGSFVLSLGFQWFAELLDILPPERGGVVIHANGIPLGPFHPAWPHLEWWVERLFMRLSIVGVAGHANPADLGLIADLTGARTVMAIHSRFPELLPVSPERLLLPAVGRPYELASLGDESCTK